MAGHAAPKAPGGRCRHTGTQTPPITARCTPCAPSSVPLLLTRVRLFAPPRADGLQLSRRGRRRRNLPAPRQECVLRARDALSHPLGLKPPLDLSTKIFGQDVRLPSFGCPTAVNCMFHWEGETAAAKAAQHHGTLYGLSLLATTGIKEMATASLARSATSSVISRLKMELVIRGLLHARIAMPGVRPCSATCQQQMRSSRHVRR